VSRSSALRQHMTWCPGVHFAISGELQARNIDDTHVPSEISSFLDSLSFRHFANTLVPIHTAVIWAYFGAKEIYF